MKRGRHVLAFLMAVFMLGVSSMSFAAETATCYNCPPEWADWASQLKAIKENLGHRHPARQQEFRADACRNSSRRRATRWPTSPISA